MTIERLRSSLKVDYGTVYILQCTIENINYYKIGYTIKTVEDRIRNMIYTNKRNGHGIFEYLLLDKFDIKMPYIVEQVFHENLTKFKAKTEIRYSGFSEMYIYDEAVLNRYLEMKNFLINNKHRCS